MSTPERSGHEPLIRMAKRGELLPAWKSWGIRVIALLLSLVVSGIVIVMVSGLNPAAVFPPCSTARWAPASARGSRCATR